MTERSTRALQLNALVDEVRKCRVCEAFLPLGARPLIHVSAKSRILIASQAPGTKAHLSGKSFFDPSGDRLRSWLQMLPEQFYDTGQIAILPMGLCYPGRLPQGGDRPPRPECAPLWRDKILSLMPDIQLTLLVGSYSQHHVLGRGSVTDRVKNFRDYLPRYFPLPHPSWRTGIWEKRNLWFQEDVIPELRRRTHDILKNSEVSASDEQLLHSRNAQNPT